MIKKIICNLFHRKYWKILRSVGYSNRTIVTEYECTKCNRVFSRDLRYE